MSKRLLLALMCAVPCLVAAQPRLAVRWHPDLKLDSLAGLDAALDAPVHQDMWVGRGARDHVVDTCRQFFEATASGLRPYNSLDYKKVVGFNWRCFALRDLATAKEPVVSYVPDHWSADIAPLIPRVFDDQTTFGNGTSVLWAGATLTEVTGDRLTIVSPDVEALWVTLLAFGDFNGDGFGDLAVYYEAWRLNDAYVVLTRCTSTGTFKVVRDSRHPGQTETRCP